MLAKASSAWLHAVFHAGPSEQMNWFTTAGAGSETPAGTRPGGDAMNGNAVMYDAGKILTLGGSPAYGSQGTGGLPAIAATAVITLTGMTATVRSVADMNIARAYCNSVVLPDGKVFTVGGMPLPVTFSDSDAVLTPGARPCGQ
jgi:galactose oxidase